MTPRDPFLEPRHEELLRTTRALALDQLEPLEGEAEKDLQAAALEAAARLGKSEVLRHVVPRAYGGASERVEARAIAVAREAVAYASGLADAMLALQGLGSLPLTLWGTDDQRRAHLPAVARGDQIAALAVTEPGAGSDIAALATRATRTRDGWELSGTKTLISNAGLASFYCVLAKTDPSAGAKGITCFLVLGDARGLTSAPIRLIAHHPVGALTLDRVQLASDGVIGRAGEGLKVALSCLDTMRPTVAAAAVGMAERALDEAVARARERQQFGRPLAENQGLRWKLAQAATDLEAARLLSRRAAFRKDTGQERVTLEASQAKFFATEAAQRIVDLAVQVHGGAGLVHGSVVERLYREVRALRIYEGASEVLLDLIARDVLDGK